MRLSFRGQHELDLETLRSRIDARVREYDARYPDVHLGQYYRWIDPRHAHAEYRGGAADIRLDEREVSLAMELPFFARLLRARIEEFVQREMDAVVRPQEK